MGGAEWVQVIREARNLEIPQHLRTARLREVENEERIHLSVGDNVTSRAHKADRVNALSRRQTTKQPNRPEVLVEHRDEGLGGRRSGPHFATGGGDAEMSLKLVHGKLVDDAAVYLAEPSKRRSAAVD
jgi:hypothetical protein